MVNQFIQTLDCHKGGLVTQQHTEVKDVLNDLAAMSYKEMINDPAEMALIADLYVFVESGHSKLRLLLM